MFEVADAIDGEVTGSVLVIRSHTRRPYRPRQQEKAVTVKMSLCSSIHLRTEHSQAGGSSELLWRNTVQDMEHSTTIVHCSSRILNTVQNLHCNELGQVRDACGVTPFCGQSCVIVVAFDI